MRHLSLNDLSLLALGLALGCARGEPGGVAPDRRAAAETAAREALASENSLGATPAQGRALGIPPFAVATADSALASLGYGLADLLTTDLARSRQLLIVDRIRLDAVLREIRLVESGRVDAATAPRVGRLVQARRLVLGRVTDTQDGGLAIDASIADVTTSELRTAVSARAAVEDILEAEKELAFRLLEELEINLSPAERAAIEQLPTRSISALLAYSRGVRYETEGRYDAAGREYAEALRLDPGFAAAAENLKELENAAPSGSTRLASAGAAQARRAASVVGDRLNWPGMSPLGSMLIASPFEGGGDLSLPTTITILIEVTE